MLVQRGAVELDEAVRVLREVRRHPVHEHADAGRVATVHEVHEVLRRPEARGRRVVATDLVAPGAVERVLGDAHQLDVGVAHVEHGRVSAKLPPDPVMGALAEQMQVEVAELGREIVRVGLGADRAIGVAHAQPVRDQRPPIGDAPLEQARGMDAGQRQGGRLRLVLPVQRDLARVRLERAHEAQRLLAVARALVVAQYRARLAMARRDERVDLRPGQRVVRCRGLRPRDARSCHHITGRMFQMRSAYSRMLRSLEKKPMLTQFTTADRLHSSGVRYRASTRSCASRYAR